MSRRTKHEWKLMKEVYIMGKIDPETGLGKDYTYSEIASLFNIEAEICIKRRADCESWREAREIYRKKTLDILNRKLQTLWRNELFMGGHHVQTN